MPQTIPYHIVPDAVPPLLAYIKDQGLRRFFLVADENTYRVLGERVQAALVDNGLDVETILLTGEEIITNEHYVVQTQVETRGESRPFIAVGSGTVTDITRFVSHRSHDIFLSIPTAPSVDGYTSTVAPMVVGSYKGPIPAQPPAAVFADLPTLCAAPRRMIAAGLGDLLGKFTSLADWRLGALLYDEPYNAEVDRMMLASVAETVADINAIANCSCEGIQRLMDGLVGAGFGMLAFGDSRPASGSEHHVGHYWEMKFILDHRPPNLHGAEVGVATVLAARRYELLRQMRKEDAKRSLLARDLPTGEAMRAEIYNAYGPIAERIIKIQEPLFCMTNSDLEQLKDRILDNWDAVQEIAKTVPSSEQIAAWIKAVDGPTTPEEIGLSREDTLLGVQTGHYSRDRFTLNRLAFWLNLPTGVG